MLIYIDPSALEELDGVGILSESTLVALNNIATSRIEGKHNVLSDRPTLKRLIECDGISSRSKSVFTKIFQNLPTQMSLLRSVSIYARVVSNLQDQGIRDYGSTKQIIIRIGNFEDTSIIQRTILLTENLRDIALYDRMAMVAFIWRGMGRINISYEPRGGGGSTISDEYRAIQDQNNRFCFCLVDGDIKIPGGQVGETAKGVIQANDDEITCSHYEVIDAHEIENLIPTKLFSDVSEGQPHRMNCVMFLEGLEKTPTPEIRRYIDLKNGLTLNQIFELNDRDPKKAFWLNILENNTFFRARIDENCLNDKDCEDVDNCFCSLSPGLGGNILDSVCSHIERQSAHKTADYVCEHLKPLWIRFGELIGSWCCGSLKLRA